MSNADHLRSGPCLPMSDRLVDIGLVEEHAPSTSPHPSPTLLGHWIRSDTRRYPQQGAAFRVLKFFPPTALAPSTSKLKRVPTLILRTDRNNHRLQKPLSPGAARHTAPHRASGRSRPPSTTTEPRPHKAWSCAANTRNPLRIQLENILQTTLSPIHTANHNTCASCEPLQPMDPPRGTHSRPVPHGSLTTPSRSKLGHCDGPLP
jgi:hypothetical protein